MGTGTLNIAGPTSLDITIGQGGQRQSGRWDGGATSVVSGGRTIVTARGGKRGLVYLVNITGS